MHATRLHDVFDKTEKDGAGTMKIAGESDSKTQIGILPWCRTCQKNY